ncbi:macro domain-containing protein [Promicromonospora kroppenstedtii]|uniref:Macro domain-containing protein n=1 Tax=Promicromonospora kroppenstedtii TaxID=440482 RepID=A0ABW7XRS9_9MICO
MFWPEWLEGQWWVILASLVLAVFWALFRLRDHDPLQKFPEGVTMRLVVGDLFEQNASTMVGMTTTFDTDVPNVIAPTSVQAAFLRSVYSNSTSTLDRDLKSALANVAPVAAIAKPGKTVVYPMGTVATIRSAKGVNYYCVAYTSMDSENRALGSIRSVLDGLDSLWDSVDKHGNGAPICVPLLGQGQSRIPELTPEVSVRLIAFSFLLRTRRHRFASELRVVVHPSEAEKVDPLEFQAFLTSLASA